jgi:5-methylcytosine-specific restriction endonuclease McrA
MDYLERNLVNLSTLSLVWKYVTPEFLSRIGGKSKKEVEAIVAEFHPALPIPDRTKPVVVEKVVKQTDDTGQQGSHKCQEIYRRSGGKLFVSVDKSAPDRDEEVVRKKVKMHDVRCLIDDTVMRDLERCKALLSGKFPKGMSYSEFLGELAGDWLKHHDPLKRAERRSKKKRRAGVEARVKSTKEDSRYIPLAVRDDVYKRDGGTCSFVGSNGKRCNSDYSLQYDHYPVPYARGGPSTVNNLRLLCAKHNRYAAEKTYGEGFIQKFVLRESGSKITYDACQYNAEHSPAYRYQARVWDRPPPVLH